MTAPTTNPYFEGPYAPVQREITASDLEVIGELPQDLRGVYLRNGPNAKFPPKGRYHWFDGDGMVHAITFRDGNASYRNRYVATAGLAQDREADGALWTGLLESTKGNPDGAPYKDTANTDLVACGDEVLALWYICGVPVRVDPHTLETLGEAGWATGATRRISAHAKYDEATGELMFFDYGVKPPFLHYGVVKDGELVRHIPVEVPGPRLPHDMAITENYSIVMDLPLFYRPEALKLRRWLVDFHRDMPARFAVVPRHGEPGDVQWFEAEPCYIYHTVNAWEDGDEVVMIGCRCDEPIPEADPADGDRGRALATLRLNASMHEWRFNRATGETSERRLDDANSEFPSVDASRLGRPTRYSYNVTIPQARTLLFDGISKYDTADGSCKTHKFGDGRFGSESPFAPAAGRADDGAEDDGYVLSFVHDAREDRSEVLVLRADDFDSGPVARVLLPQRVPLGFHGCWVAD